MKSNGVVPPHLFVFFTGAAVMATEMSASRFIAPWFGTSMIVWSVLIAVVLAAMSLGYWVWGRLADRRPYWKILFSIPVATGVLMAVAERAERMSVPVANGTLGPLQVEPPPATYPRGARVVLAGPARPRAGHVDAV